MKEDIDIKWLEEYAEQEKKYKWGKEIKKLIKGYKELEEQLRKANEYIRNEMYIDDNPTICGDEEDTITELPISLYLYNEGLRELLKLLEERN